MKNPERWAALVGVITTIGFLYLSYVMFTGRERPTATEATRAADRLEYTLERGDYAAPDADLALAVRALRECAVVEK